MAVKKIDIGKDLKIDLHERIDMKKYYEERKRDLARAQKKWDSEVKKEKNRIDTMPCPCCKSAKKEHIVKSVNNGVIGPGYSSRVTADYYVCLDCGVHYTDLKKKDLGKRPKDYLSM